MSPEKTPKVSVCVITYNQEKYIGQCLRSIIDQNVDFDFEIIVGDDYSTDNTREILSEFKAKYPAIINLLFQEANTGGTKNYIDVHNLAKGQYVAHCDGDDYFLQDKLRLQAEMLDKFPMCSMVYGQAITVDNMDIRDNNQKLFLKNPEFFRDLKFTVSDVLRYGTIGAHSSLMYRRTSRVTVSASGPVLDYYYTLEFLSSGFGCYINQPLSVRRLQVPNSISSIKNSQTPLRELFVKCKADFLESHPEYRKDVFLGSLFMLVQDMVVFLKKPEKRCNIYSTIQLAIKSISFITPYDVWRYMVFLKT